MRPLAWFGGSLKQRLMAWLLLPLLLLVPLAAVLLYSLSLRPALDGLDHALSGTVVALARILEVQADGRATLPLDPQTALALRADPVDEVDFAVGDGQGALLGGDPSLLQRRPPLQAGEWQFFDGELRGADRRIAALGVACGAAPCTVMAAESLQKRRTAMRSVAGAAIAAALLLAASLGLLAWLAVLRGLEPLQRVSAQIRARSLDQLDPISLQAVPEEAASFAQSLNDLFARLRAAAQAQRAFVENASHQLRTPLTILLSESTQALQRPHPPDLAPTLQRLHAAAGRGARLSQQLLTLARADSAARDGLGPGGPVDLPALVAEAANEWLAPSLAAGQDLGFDLQPAVARGHAPLLRELVGNLVDNARLYAGPGARVTVRTRCDGAQALIEVEDDGPGLAPDEAPTVWDRFVRGRRAAAQGSGLGLAIVRDIAQAHGGTAELSAATPADATPDPQRPGLRVVVRLPALRSDPD